MCDLSSASSANKVEQLVPINEMAFPRAEQQGNNFVSEQCFRVVIQRNFKKMVDLPKPSVWEFLPNCLHSCLLPKYVPSRCVLTSKGYLLVYSKELKGYAVNISQARYIKVLSGSAGKDFCSIEVNWSFGDLFVSLYKDQRAEWCSRFMFALNSGFASIRCDSQPIVLVEASTQTNTTEKQPVCSSSSSVGLDRKLLDQWNGVSSVSDCDLIFEDSPTTTRYSYETDNVGFSPISSTDPSLSHAYYELDRVVDDVQPPSAKSSPSECVSPPILNYEKEEKSAPPKASSAFVSLIGRYGCAQSSELDSSNGVSSFSKQDRWGKHRETGNAENDATNGLRTRASISAESDSNKMMNQNATLTSVCFEDPTEKTRTEEEMRNLSYDSRDISFYWQRKYKLGGGMNTSCTYLIKWSCLCFLAFIIFLPLHIQAQINCADAPTAAARIVCEQLHKWDTNARAAPPVSTKVALPPAIPGLPSPFMAAELAPIASTPYQCMDLGCLCSYMGGNGQQGSNACTLANGRRLNKAVRKEYRMMSDEERDRFHAAFRQLKNSGEYDRLSVIHSQFASAGGAHSGPAFLPWHREYIKRIEIAIRQIDPTLALPYWDSVLDNNLPSSRDSILWTDDFMGGSDAGGNVNSGPFTNWRTISGRGNILRRVGAQGTLFTETELGYVLRQTQVENVLAFTAPRQGCTIQTNWNVLEYTHGNVHIYVGGDMLDQSTSANDPIFFLHHSFVDLIWELWRQQKQTRFDRENAFPMDMQLCSSAQHLAPPSCDPLNLGAMWMD
uniref:Tyrosinase copper-binding domain-containing protein n=1 Tax=Ditylenchus dipsaci TaxID=166011 RepID=A0A915DFA9_9BILA